MKLNITLEDLEELSEGQRRSLRSLWFPQRYDLAAAFVCTNVETEETDKIQFIIGDVMVEEINGGKRVEVKKNSRIYGDFNVTLRSLRLVNEEIGENPEENPEENTGGKEEDSKNYDFDYEYIRQEDYFKLEYCLPLLNVGQMISMLQELGYLSEDYNIKFNKDTNMYLLVRLDSEYLDGAVESEELCNLLWNKIKDYL